MILSLGGAYNHEIVSKKFELKKLLMDYLWIMLTF